MKINSTLNEKHVYLDLMKQFDNKTRKKKKERNKKASVS